MRITSQEADQCLKSQHPMERRSLIAAPFTPVTSKTKGMTEVRTSEMGIRVVTLKLKSRNGLW